MLYLLMPVVVWVALRDQKTHTVLLWCVGGQVYGASVVLFGIRNLLPAWVTYDVAMLLLYAGCAMRVQSLRTELGRPFAARPLLSLILVPFAVYEVLRFVTPSEVGYFVWSHLTLAAMLFWCSKLARDLGQQQQLRSATGLGVTYLPMALLLLVRTALVTTGSASQDLLNPDAVTVGVTLLGGLSAVLGNTSFLGMFIERATRKQMQQVEQQARREESERLGRQIAHLDRQRGLGMMAAELAHEISQPMASIHLVIDLAELDIAQGKCTPDMYREHLQSIGYNADVAQAIMDRIRNYIKSQESPHQSVTLQAVVDNVLRLMEDWLRTEGVKVKVSAPSAPLQVLGDAVQLSQILVNLLRNAGQASAGQALQQVQIVLAQEGEQATVRVQDNGPGFRADVIANSTTPFQTDKAEGLGVGLAISKHIAEQHKGKLTIGNATDGGAVVTLTLPLLPPEA